VAVNVEVKKPIRFFFFFGLFLVFILFGVKACNDRRTEQEVAEIEEILNDYDNELIPSRIAPDGDNNKDSSQKVSKKSLKDSNEDELSSFSSKKPTKLKVDRSKAKAVIQVRSKKDKEIESAATPKIAEKSEKKSVSDVIAPSKSVNKTSKVASNTKSAGSSKIRVSVDGEPYKLNAISLAKLKGAVKLYPKPNRVEIQIFSQDAQKRSSVVKQAEIKSTLIRLGLPTNTKMDFKTLDKVGFADVVFY